MTDVEIKKAIEKYELEDEYYNFNTLFGKYVTYCMICFFENRKLKVTRIKNNKAEIRVFKNGNSLSMHWYNVRDNYNKDLENGEDKILEFEII